MWIFLFLCLLLKHNSIFKTPAYTCFVSVLLFFSSYEIVFFVILLLYVKTQPNPFHSVMSLTDVFLLLASGLGAVEGSLAMPADSCSIIQCPGIILFIHLDTGCVLQKINKTCFENVPSFLEYSLHSLSSGVCCMMYLCVIENIMSLKALK